MESSGELQALAGKHEQVDSVAVEELCRRGIQVGPQDAEGWFRLGELWRAQGKMTQAISAYHKSLELQPQQNEWKCRLADCLIDLGNLNEAETILHQVVKDQPQHIEAHLRLAQSLSKQGHVEQSLLGYQYVLRLQPSNVEALVNLGVILAKQGRSEEAVTYLRQAIQFKPGLAQAHLNLGVALAGQGELETAVSYIQEAIRLKQDYAEAHYNLGNTHWTIGRKEEAEACFRNAIHVRPDYAVSYNNLGLLLTEIGKLDEAEIILRQAVRLEPDSALAHNNLGLALADQGRLDEAISSYEEALKLNPRYAEAHANLASALKDCGQYHAALASYTIALWHRPSDASTHWNRSLALLQMGNYEEGWSEYEWRWKRKQYLGRSFPPPQWNGSDLVGKTILLWMEQGLGDILQFIRYTLLIKQRGARVIVEAPTMVHRLLSTCPGIDQLVAEEKPNPKFDYHAPLLSLPHIFKTTLASIPSETPYLFADQELVKYWRERLKDIPGFKIGIAWQGNPYYKFDRHRSIPLRYFQVLAQIPGLSLISLQKVHGVDQLRTIQNRFSVVQIENVDEDHSSFIDTAAIMKNLDLVICADTACGHLAGALGIPVWIAVSTMSDWRWLANRDDTPWYPTMRLFRQPKLGDWASVFARMATEIRNVRARRLSSESDRVRTHAVKVEVSPGELIDRITILQIKKERFIDTVKANHVSDELEALKEVMTQYVPGSVDILALTTELKEVNNALWEVEDRIHQCEQAEQFGLEFITLARSVYRHNDRRYQLKRRINDLLGVHTGEQKE